MKFPGANSYVDVGHVGIPNEFTCELWFNAAATQVNFDSIILTKDADSVQENQFRIGIRKSHVYFMMSGPQGQDGGLWTGSDYQLRTPGTVSSGVWYHVAVTKGGSRFTLYLDGVPQSTYMATASLSNGSTTALLFGGRGTAERWWFTGLVDELRLWNMARSQSAIDADRVHTISSSNVDYGSLVSYWKLEEGTGTLTVDSRGAANGTLSAGITWVTPGAPLQ